MTQENSGHEIRPKITTAVKYTAYGPIRSASRPMNGIRHMLITPQIATPTSADPIGMCNCRVTYSGR